MKAAVSSVVALVLHLAATSGNAADFIVPKPFVIAPECTELQREGALKLLKPTDPLITCYQLEKWSFKGVALAFEPINFAGRTFSESEFYQLRKEVFREQSVRLRNERDLKETMPGKPPTHAAIPLSLFIRTRTPLGVFLNEAKHIGFADLIPVLSFSPRLGDQERYPLIQSETFALMKGRVIKLVQVAPITGPNTVGEAYRMADDWARRVNGGERPASED
jgi:hypothetical protein